MKIPSRRQRRRLKLGRVATVAVLLFMAELSAFHDACDARPVMPLARGKDTAFIIPAEAPSTRGLELAGLTALRIMNRGLAGASMPLAFDTRYGTATAANGDITLGLRPGCRRIWCDSKNGSDLNDGLTYLTPKKTYNPAWTLWSNSGLGGGSTTPGDQLMIAGGEGQTYTDSVAANCTFFEGYSNTYPNAVLSYDSRAPTNAALYGRLVEDAMPIINIGTSLTKSALHFGYMFVQGVELKDQTGNEAAFRGSISFVFDSQGIPGIGFQNVRLNGVGLSWTTSGATTNTPEANVQGGHVSKVSMWNGGGIFAASIDSLWISDVVAVHNGWSIGAVREDDVQHGAAIVFTHHFYLHASCTNLHLHRIVAGDGSIGGVDPRGDVASSSLWVSIDNPVGITGGHFSSSYLEAPNGVRANLYDGVICGGDICNAYNPGGSNPGTIAMTFDNNIVGSHMTNVVLFDNPLRSGDDSRYVGIERVNAAQPEMFMLLNKWSAWDYAPTELSNIMVDPTHCHLDWANSDMEMALVGHNGTVTNCTQRLSAPPGYLTRPQTWAAVGGYTSKAAMYNDMLWTPHLPWAQRIASVSLPAMGRVPSFGSVAASAIAPATTAPVIYPTALGALTLTSQSFQRGTPKVVRIGGNSAAAKLSCTDLPAGFSISFAAVLFGSATGSTSGSNQITGCSNLTGVTPGMYIRARDLNNFGAEVFSKDAFIVAVSGSTVTVSENANATSTNLAVDFTGGGRAIRYDGSGSGAASPTIHVDEISKDTLGTRQTAFTLAIAA